MDDVGRMVALIDQTLEEHAKPAPEPTAWEQLQALLLAHGATLKDVR